MLKYVAPQSWSNSTFYSKTLDWHIYLWQISSHKKQRMKTGNLYIGCCWSISTRGGALRGRER